MLHFNMSTKQNFASFIDKESGLAIFVDSFDNVDFDVRVGSVSESKHIATLHAESDHSLNYQLTKLLEKE